MVVGDGASAIVEGAVAGRSRSVAHHDRAAIAEAALDHLRSRLRDGDVVLIKASRGIALDELVEALRAEFGSRS